MNKDSHKSTPAPNQTPVESADGTKGLKIVDSNLAVWTIDQAQHLLVNGVDTTGHGRGTLYLYKDKQVYVLGLDNNWWRYQPATWVLSGSTEPGSSAPPVIPPIPTTVPTTPTPPPTPTPTQVTESQQNLRDVSVVDKKLVTWTIDQTKLLRDGVDTGGKGSAYVYHNNQVYALGTDSNWYAWDGQKWVFYGDTSFAPDAPPRPRNLVSKTCVNLSSFGAWSGVDPFLNRFKRSGHWWHQGGVTNSQWVDPKDGWLRGIPNGESISHLITVNNVAGVLDLAEQRAGTHYLMWKNSLDIAVGGWGADGKPLAGSVVEKGKYAFEVPPTVLVDGVPTLANPNLNLEIKNNSGGVLDFVPTVENGVQYPALVHSEDMARFLEGKHFQASYINSLSGADYVRTMDWNLCPMPGVGADGTIFLPSIEPPDFYTGMSYSFTAPDNNTKIVPPELIGYLVKEANVGLFNSMPAKCSDAAFEYWAQTFVGAAGSDWNKEVQSELGDENWNTAWPWIIGPTYLRDKIAPSIKVVDIDGNPSTGFADSVGCAAMSRALSMWTIMEKYIPRERHKRVVGGQFAYPQALGGQLSYIDPTTGKRVSELADYYAVAPYWNCDLSDVTMEQIIGERMWELDVNWWIDRCKHNIDMMGHAVEVNQHYLEKYAPNMKLTCYEGGGWITEMPVPKTPAGAEFDQFLRRFMEGEPGKQVMQYYWDTFIKGNFMLYNQYTDQSYYYGVQMGLHLSQHRKDTPRQALFRTLGK